MTDDTYGESEVSDYIQTEAEDEVGAYIEEVENRDIDHKNMVVLKPSQRLTMARLSKFEMCEIISIRSEQIAKNDIMMVDKGDLDNPIDMAKKELKMRKCPLILRRKVGEKYNNDTRILTEYYEFWDVNEMAFPVKYATA